MAASDNMSNEQFYGPYLYHGSPKKFRVGEVIRTPKEINPDEETYATEDVLYAGDFAVGEGAVHKVVPVDWNEIQPFDAGNDPPELMGHPEPKHRHGTEYYNFSTNKGYKVIGHSNFSPPRDLQWNDDENDPQGGRWTSGGKRWHRPVRGSGQD